MADEQIIQQDIPEQQTGQHDPTQALYDNLHKAQLYTKSFDEFKQKYSTPQAIDDLYGKLNGLQLYTKGKQDFYQKYFPSSQEKPFVAPKVELMEPPKTGSLGPSGSKEFGMQGDEDRQAKDQANKLGTKAVQGVNLINTHLQGNDKEYENVVRQSRSDAVNWQAIKNDYAKKGILIPIGHEQETINREKQKAYNLPVSQNDIEDARTSVGSSHGLARQFVNKIAKDNTELKSALYHVDAAKSLVNDPNAKERLPKILRNGKMIENGDVDYNAETGQLTRQQGFWGSLLSSFDESEQLKKNYEDYKGIINPDALISKLRSDEKDRQDEPQNEAKGFLGGLGRIVGGSPFKALAAGAVAGAIPGAEETAPAAMAAVGAPDYYKMSYAAEFPRAFKEFTDQGLNDYDALEKAKQSADQAGNFSAMSATVQNLVGGKFATETELPAMSEFKKYVLDGLKQAAKFTGEKLREGGTIGAIGGTGQILQNIAAQEMGLNRETFEGVKDQVLTGSLIPLAMTLAIKAPQALKKSTYNNILHHLSKVPEENIQPVANELKANGVATDEEIQNAQNTIQKESQLNKLIPDDIDELSTLKIKAKIKERDILKDKLETTDEAFHPDIKERIKGLNEDIIELSKNKKPKTDGNETEKTEANAQAEGVLNAQGADKTNIAGAAPSLTPEAEQLLESVKSGSKPAFISKQLEKIAADNGIEITGKSTPDDIISQLQEKQKPKGDITDEKSANTIKPKSDLIQPTDVFRTWDLGDMEGKPEDEAAQKHIEGVVRDWDTKPATDATDPTKQGETFGEFINRVIPPFDKALKEEPNNSTIITHSSVLKAMKVWDEMGRPDVANLTPEQKTEFATRYNDAETHNADLENFKSNNGELNVIRHGQTEDNAKNNFRTGNTPLTEKGISQAKEAGQQLKDKTGNDVPKIISSDLPRAIHTSNLITEQLKPTDNAIRERSSAQVGAHSNGDGGTGRPVESKGMGSSQQGEGFAGESPGTSQENKTTGQETALAGKEQGGNRIGVSHESLKQFAEKAGLKEPERGEYLPPEWYANRGREFLEAGFSPDEVNNPANDLHDRISIARAHLEDLAKTADDIAKKNPDGVDSDEYKKAEAEAIDYALNTVKKLGTLAHRAFESLQGERDIDTGSFTTVKKAVQDKTGEPVSKEQETKIKELINQNNLLKKQLEEADKKLVEVTDKEIGDEKKTTKAATKKSHEDYVKERKDAFTAARDALKKLRSGESGLGVGVPLVRELTAIAPHIAKVVKSLIEEGVDKIGDIVDTIHEELSKDMTGLRRRDVIDLISGEYNKKEDTSPEVSKYADIKKQSRLIKKLEDLQQGLPENFETNPKEQTPEVKKLIQQILKVKKDLADMGYMKAKKTEPLSPEEKNINRLQKELDDLSEGKAKQSSPSRELSDKEKDLKDQIRDAREKMGLVKSKGKKPLTEDEQVNADEQELEGLQKQFEDKTGNKFTTDEAKSIWDYAKKNYLDKGISYRDMISNVSNDLGLSWRQVNDAITTPKTKPISDAMWKKNYDLRRNQVATKNWIDEQDRTQAGKILGKVSGLFRGVSVFGHGGIFIGTHAGPTLFQPSTWQYVVPAFFRGWKFAYGNEGEYARQIEGLKNRDNYVLAQKAGLQNNPERINREEYQKSQQFLGKLGMAGEKGFNAIKILRQDLFDYHYNKLSKAAKADSNSAKQIAWLVNNATGATNLTLPKWVNEVSFAGGMEAARWGKLTTNPIKAVSIAIKALVTPDKVPVSDRVFAKVWARRVGEQLATLTGLLVANSALQSVVSPENPVNLTNPDKPDFLKFKFGNTTIDPTSGMRGAALFAYGIGKIPFEDKQALKGDTRWQAFGKSSFGYGRGKLAPMYSTMADFFTHQDFDKNEMPFSEDEPKGTHRKLTWGEYAWEKAPLPIAEAAKVFYESASKNSGDNKTLNSVLDGIMSGAISGSTGFRVGEYNAQDQQTTPKSSIKTSTHDKGKSRPTPKHR